MHNAAKKSDRDHKESQDKSALCRLDASLSCADAHRLAEECLELAAYAQTAAARYKWIQQWQYLCFALVGPRAQLLMVSQDYGHTTFRPAFGSGEQYSAPLFKHAAYCRQPACLARACAPGNAARPRRCARGSGRGIVVYIAMPSRPENAAVIAFHSLSPKRGTSRISIGTTSGSLVDAAQ